MLRSLLSVLEEVTLLVLPHGGQKTARRNAWRAATDLHVTSGYRWVDIPIPTPTPITSVSTVTTAGLASAAGLVPATGLVHASAGRAPAPIPRAVAAQH